MLVGLQSRWILHSLDDNVKLKAWNYWKLFFKANIDIGTNNQTIHYPRHLHNAPTFSYSQHQLQAIRDSSSSAKVAVKES